MRLVFGRPKQRSVWITASVEGHIWGVLETVNAFLHFYFKDQCSLRIPALYRV